MEKISIHCRCLAVGAPLRPTLVENCGTVFELGVNEPVEHYGYIYTCLMRFL